MPNYWLIKSEPYEFSWQQLLSDKKTDWTGVRNYTARNNLRLMKKGDLAFFYHSNEGQEIVGIAKVTREHFPDPTAKGDTWSSVEFAPVKPLKTPVALKTLKQDVYFAQMDLVRLGRLSVGKVTPEQFAKICAMGGVKV
ncbi:MAG TPA: EVE domain-containing protein [Candidatus Acidoferrum sp.]|nr:EVE domain-containing protein [Candidatus Acidoferrum sp.]